MNLILATDSYKMTHWNQYPEATTGVYSYLEARPGAEFPATVFFGLQPLLEQLERGFTYADVFEAYSIAAAHFGSNNAFNERGWEALLVKHAGQLPLRIKAVPEGTVVPTGNVLMTVENTDPEFPWLTNYFESLLLHVWYPTTVASLSYSVKQMMKEQLAITSDNPEAVNFMLHDFGYRGVSSHESAAIGGAAHLVNFLGTDTLPAMQLAMHSYDADLESLAFSVPATEHSVMTSLGRAGEMRIVSDLITAHPTGILSVVADSYDIYNFMFEIGTTFYDRIMGRDGKFVVRPDSVTETHPTPEALCASLIKQLWIQFGGTVNSKGFKVLDQHIGLLWGDGIGPDGIKKILDTIRDAGFSAENMVFGMGGGLLQKVNRDTQRFAFKCAAQKRNRVWVPVSKGTYGKASKAGRLKLVSRAPHGFTTVTEDKPGDDVLRTVFEDGQITARDTFDEIRARAK